MKTRNENLSRGMAHAALAAALLFWISGCASGTAKHEVPAAVPVVEQDMEERAPIIEDVAIEAKEIALPPETPESQPAPTLSATEWDPNAKICLALGPGMARGFGHAGILEAVAESGLKPYCIVGTEMGALVGALYALNTNTNTLQWQLFKIRKETYLDYPLFAIKDKLAQGEKLQKFLLENFGNKRISDMKIPFAITATDANGGNAVLFRDEVIADAVAASLAVPNVFRSHEVGSKGFFMSGSASSPLPIKEAFQLGATHVIAVDLLGESQGSVSDGEIGKQFVVARNLAKLQRDETNYVISPDLRAFSFVDFDKRVEIVSVSKRAAAEALVKIRAAMRPPVVAAPVLPAANPTAPAATAAPQEKK